MGGSIINLTISLILIHYYGLAGVAASTAIASIIVNFFIIPMLAQKLVSLSIKDFFCSACVRPVAVAVLLVVLMTCIRLAGKPSSWFDLILQGVGAGLGSIVVVLGVGVTTDERHRFLVHPLVRLRNKVRAGREATGY
jgi:O-antigen/teichoic acid export membrane protein